MVIGNTVGSSYDTYARVLAAHLTRHIPGNPTIINQNMPVAASMQATNWAFEQAPTSLNLFARDFTDRQLGSFQVPATWFQSINALFVIIFAPVFAWIWVSLGKRGRDLSSPGTFSLGLLLAACVELDREIGPHVPLGAAEALQGLVGASKGNKEKNGNTNQR